MFKRRTLIGAPLALAASRAAWADAADNYPNRSVRLIVPYPPGGGGDAVARIIAPKLQDALGQTFIIDNRPGAGASIGTDLAAKAPPDGYTILETPGAALTVNPQLMHAPYDPIKDLAPVAMVSRARMIYVCTPSLPVTTMQEFIAYAKANPGKLNFGSAGNGTITQLSWEMVKLATGIDIVHVPYKGSGPAINDLLAGHIQAFSESVLLPYIRAGQMRALAVSGDDRWPALPDVPTVKETGLTGVNPSAWYRRVRTLRDASGHYREALGGRAKDRSRSRTEAEIRRDRHGTDAAGARGIRQGYPRRHRGERRGDPQGAYNAGVIPGAESLDARPAGTCTCVMAGLRQP